MAATKQSGNAEEPLSPFRTPVTYITTHTKEAKATIHSSNANSLVPYGPGLRVNHKLVYSSERLPMDLNEETDIEKHQALEQSGNPAIVKKDGTICRVVDFGPGNFIMMHRTQSLDFGVILEGSILMQLDDGSETLMTKGDVAVQRATMHAWKNPSETEWARLLFVLQDCQPLMINGKRFNEELGHTGTAVFGSSGNDDA